MVEIPPRSAHTENPVTPEKPLIYEPLLGLQGRLAIGGSALFPLNTTELTHGINKQNEQATVALLNKASVRERGTYWAAQTAQSKDEQLAKWKKSVTAKINLIPKSSLGKDHAEFFTKIGITATQFTEEEAQRMYDKYFSKANTGGQGLNIFVADVVRAFTTHEGAVDTTSLKSHLPALQWMAGMFGGNSAEIITQLIDTEIESSTNEAAFVSARKDKVNNLTHHETELLTFLTEGETVRLEPPLPQQTPDNPTIIRTEPIITITPEEIDKLSRLNTKPEVVTLGKDAQGRDMTVHVGFPDKKDTNGHILFPSDPYVFIADELTVSDKNHNETLKKVCVIAAHGIKTQDNTWKFLNQQEIYDTVSKYNAYAQKNGLPPIEFIMSCNAPGQPDKIDIISINTGDGTIVQSDNASINVSLYTDVTTGEHGATASFRNGEFIGIDDLIRRKKRQEAIPASELDTHVKHAAEYLGRLDKQAEEIEIDSVSGEILEIVPYPAPVLKPHLSDYERRYTELQRKFEAQSAAHITELNQTPGVLDAKLVMGALVITYDSSKQTPPNLPYVEFIPATDTSRGRYGRANKDALGVVVIDLNQNKRADNVPPTVSAVHELQHHALAMSDYLLATDPTLPLASAYRSGRNEALFGDQHIQMSDDLFERDFVQYEKVMGRHLVRGDVNNIRDQLAYLDELHSSFMQKKPNWFSAAEDVYSSSSPQKKKHWELVGNSASDIESSKRLLRYSQGLYHMTRIRDVWAKRTDLGPEQTAFMTNIDAIFNQAGSYIGTARSVQQAERLVGDLWESLKAQFPRTLEMPELTESFLIGETTGAALPGTARFLFD